MLLEIAASCNSENQAEQEWIDDRENKKSLTSHNIKHIIRSGPHDRKFGVE